MRNLFLLLLLGNLGFAAWYQWIAKPATDVRVVQISDMPSIALVSELTESPSEPESVEAVVPPAEELEQTESPSEPLSVEVAVPPAEELEQTLAAEPVARCVGIGPFSELARFTQIMTILGSAGYAPTQRSEDGDVWLGHWVYLENVTTQGQADTLNAVLAEHGISDTYFDPSGAQGEVLSLGVFREFNRAETVRIRVLALGFAPEMTDRTRPGTLYWADLTLATEEDLDLQPLQTAGRIIRLEERACAAADG